MDKHPNDFAAAPKPVSLLAVATAVPPHGLNQAASRASRARHLRPQPGALSQARRCLRQCRHRAALFSAPARMVHGSARLARAHAGLSRRRRRVVHASRACCACARRHRSARRRCRGHRLVHRHRDAEPGSARFRRHGIQAGCAARAGVRARLRRRRGRPCPRRAACARGTGRGRAGGRGRIVHARLSVRPRRARPT